MFNLDRDLVAFTDGACKGNPGPGGWGVILAYPDGSVQELGGRQESTTNNQMEMTAVANALTASLQRSESLLLFCDSKYVLDGLRSWVTNWERNGWRTASGSEVLNRRLWEELWAAYKAKKAQGGVELRYVAAHVGIVGNERVDAIASGFALGDPVPLYSGARAAYGYDLSSLEPTGSSPTKGSKGKPWYVSFVNGIFTVHKTWKECESTVKGHSYARYRKVTSKAEEETLKKDWSK